MESHRKWAQTSKGVLYAKYSRSSREAIKNSGVVLVDGGGGECVGERENGRKFECSGELHFFLSDTKTGFLG